MVMDSRSGPAWRVCKGRLYVNEDEIAVSRRVFRIALFSGGFQEPDACADIPEPLARRMLHMERTLLLSGLAERLRAQGAPKERSES